MSNHDYDHDVHYVVSIKVDRVDIDRGTSRSTLSSKDLTARKPDRVVTTIGHFTMTEVSLGIAVAKAKGHLDLVDKG